MFPGAFFPEEYFTGTYFPPVGAVIVVGYWVIFITMDE